MIGTCKGIILGFLLSSLAPALFAANAVPYVENKNQWPDAIRFAADFPQMKIMLKDASIFFVQHSLISNDSKSRKKLRTDPSKESHVHTSGDLALATFELSFLDALLPSIIPSRKQK